jgi:capsular exopolysaccharide synthesis family protein
MTDKSDNLANYLSEFISDLLKYWYLVVISVAILVGGSVFYIKFAARSYKITSSVLLNVERSNAFGANSDDMMRVYDLIEKDKNLQNEIYFFQSTPLIRSVVEDMDLQVSYFLQEDKIPKEMEFSMKDLYLSAPFIVIPNKQHLQPVNTYLYINIINEESYKISGFSKDAMIVDFRDESVVVPATPFSINGTFRFGEEVGNSFTSFRILLNSNYKAEEYQGKDLFFLFNTIDALTGKFKRSLTVESSAIDATMIEMSINSSNRQKGMDFLNGLINKYIEYNLEEKNYLATKTIEHLDFQLADISQSLGSSEEELQNIRRSSSVMNVDEKAGNLYNQLQEAESERDEIERRRSSLQQMSDYFNSNRESDDFLAPSAMGIDDPLLSNLIQELTNLTTERQEFINNNQLRSPRLRTIETTIGNLKMAILENLQYSIATTESELREVNRRISQLDREYKSMPYTQRRLLGIERKFNLSENVYMSLLEQRIQAQIIKASTLPDCEIVEPPQFASIHAPKSMIVLIAALFLGLLLPILFVLIKKMFTRKILTKDELKHVTALNQIGSIPQHSRANINVIKEQPNSIVSEAFHSLRSNIIYYLMGKEHQIILVTSSMAGEGKSFSALNLASSLAITNNKTALVEFDLRNPSDLYEKLGIRGLVGVSSYLINKASLDEITISSELPNLDIILAGQIPPNPVELLSSDNTTKLFRELQANYDYIIVDTPPYGLLTDSFVLMKYADISLYVTRIGYVNKKLLLSCLDDIASKDIKNLHLLINSDTPKSGSYGKYYTTHKRDALKIGKNRKGNANRTQKQKKPVEVN